MALEKMAYKNPLDYLIFKESKTCSGCHHQQDLKLGGVVYKLCSLGKLYGTKCKKYKEKL